MLPILLFNKFNNMEGSSNSLNNNPNNSFGQLYDDNVILNCVRSRKKVSELPNCPVCSCTIRQGELDSHLSLEVERLHKLSNGGSKRKLSVNSSGSGSNLALPGSSTSTDIPEEDVDVTGCPGGDVYLRINTNRLRRLRARRRCTPPPPQGQCPICNETVQTSRLQRHALRCLKRTGAPIDEDVPDTSSEEGSIDVENDADAPSVDDEPSGSGGPFGAEYQWCGEWRVRATALQAPAAGAATSVRRASHDQALVVDGDEDSELYGPPQYPPSAIAVDTELHSRTEDHAENGTEETNGEQEDEEEHLKPKGMVEASAETRIQALKAKIRDLEKKQNSSEAKCLICLGGYTSPAVSIQCWHVYCEVCWLQSLRAKKICPQCNAITTADHLRRIYM